MSGTPTPVLFYGSREDPTVLQTNVGATDNGVEFDLKALTNAVAPAGASGECIFKNTYLTITTEESVPLIFTPVIDFRRVSSEAVSIATYLNPPANISAGERYTERFEVGLSLPYNNDAFRAAMRGAWFQIEVGTEDGNRATDIIIEQVELEFEVVRETLQAEN